MQSLIRKNFVGIGKSILSKRVAASSVVAMALAAAALPSFAAGWTLKDLGAFGSGSSYARGITPTGQVVGYSIDSDGLPYAFISNSNGIVKIGSGSGAAMMVNAQGVAAGGVTSANKQAIDVGLFSGQVTTDLGGLGGSSNSAYAINNAAQVVGYGTLASGDQHPFVATTAGMVDLGNLGGHYGKAVAINGNGEITGNSMTAANVYHCFISYGTGLVDIGSLSSNGGCVASAINSNGLVVGYANNGTATHAFLYDGQKLNDLGTLGGKTSSAAAINDSGTIVGQAAILSGVSRAFVFTGSQMTNLGTLGPATGNSAAISINASGQILGNYSTTVAPTSRPFFYSSGVMTDLNSLVPGLTAIDPSNIYLNDAGQIAGTGTINGQQHAFLLTPTP